MCTLHYLQYSYKCVSTYALERNILIQSAFMNRITNQVPNPDMLIFINEATCNRSASAWAKGWSLVRRRCMQWWHFICEQRFSILLILTLDSVIIYNIISGLVNSECFIQFLCKLVMHLFLDLFYWNVSNTHYGHFKMLTVISCYFYEKDNSKMLSMWPWKTAWKFLQCTPKWENNDPKRYIVIIFIM